MSHFLTFKIYKKVMKKDTRNLTPIFDLASNISGNKMNKDRILNVCFVYKLYRE